ncbi:MAG: hypothetical protein ACK4E0_01635 [Chitinophagaceae bacterium]
MIPARTIVTALSSFCFISLAGCKSSSFGYAVKGEETALLIREKPDAIDYASMKPTEIPTLADRAERARGGNRGLPLVGSAVSLATNAIKKMIANDRKKYTADYSFALSDLYFYDQLSTESVFDPAGMQFSGFKLIRTFQKSDGSTDTAFVADIVLDTTRSEEIFQNSFFRLRLNDLSLRYAKAKLTTAQKKTLNMDIEISFQCSYVNQLGQLFDRVELGKFYLSLRDAPIDRTAPGYQQYYTQLKGKLLDGRSFIVPRSFGYYLNELSQPERAYSQGAYSIIVKVKESSKDKFVTTMLVDNSNKLIELLGDKMKKALD